MRYLPGTIIAVFIGLAVFAGCGGGRTAPAKSLVTGTVTLDGKPLADGEIYFISAAGKSADVLPIAAGSFTGDVSVGKQFVQIASYKVTRKRVMPEDREEEFKENVIPAKYSYESTLTADIQPGSNPPLSFELTGEPKKAAKPGS